jgi:hypothetical protein
LLRPLSSLWFFFPFFSRWQNYNGGIYPEGACGRDMADMDHGVQLVGYGVENGVNFWLIRNSWDNTWGESGFIRVKAGVNHCGFANYPLYAVAAPLR